jgi:hypothetical protein
MSKNEINMAAVYNAPVGMNNCWRVLSYFLAWIVIVQPHAGLHSGQDGILAAVRVLPACAVGTVARCFEIMYTQDNEKIK